MKASLNRENKKFCSVTFEKDMPSVYLTLNPISRVSWLGKITQRQLVLNWKHRMTKNGDWIGLFSFDVSNGINGHGKKYYALYAFSFL